MASMNVNPMFISRLPLDNELYGFLSPMEPRSEGHKNRDTNKEKETKKTAITLDDGSTLYLFNDDFLLENIH